jgi:hypothetical protein
MAWMAIIRLSARTSTITSSRFPPGSTDHEHLGWVGIGVEIDRHQLVLDRVQHVVVADAMLHGRSMDLHRR